MDEYQSDQRLRNCQRAGTQETHHDTNSHFDPLGMSALPKKVNIYRRRIECLLSAGRQARLSAARAG